MLFEVSVCIGMLDVATRSVPALIQICYCKGAILLENIVYKWSHIDIYVMKLVLENYEFLVYMYYTHPGYQTSIFGKKNNVYYIRILTVSYYNRQNFSVHCCLCAIAELCGSFNSAAFYEIL